MPDLTFRDLDPGEMFNLRELTVDQLGRAAEKLFKAGTGSLKVHRRSSEFLEQALVESGENVYEVVYMGLMARCSCPNWELGHAACKHMAAVLPPYCRSCFVTPAAELAGQCDLCGPGKVLPVGTRFTVHKILGRKPVLEVTGMVSETECEAKDTTLPRWDDDDAPKFFFRLNVLDSYRSQELLKIVYKPLDI